jgi:putative superfamily III holin-X
MTDPTTPSERQAANSSLGELVSEVTSDMSTLMRKELALAKAELRESAAEAAKGGAELAAGAYAGMMAILFLSIAFWWALGTLIGNGWSGVVTAVIWGIIAAILIPMGRKNLKNVKGAPQTVDTLKEIPEALKRNEENR